ncbi:MAG: hypothetical protein M0Z76_09365 [Gammaproteobacteria bacterium]|nr:hypothetical protein [Gammaproteobacteria bacterium]
MRIDQGLSWVTVMPRATQATVIIDTRRWALCRRRTLAGALCLPPHVFLGPHGRLANFQDIRWLLGTANLNGQETAMVIGDHRTPEDFVAGILYLAGQRQVVIVRRPLTPWLASHPAATGPGQIHGLFRTVYYTAWPRTRLVVFRRPLAHALRGAAPPYLLDGRPLNQYTGQCIRSLRGGHIPAAQPLPFSRLAPLGARISPPPGVRQTVAYAQNPYRSIAYFTALHLDGWPARVFAGGWRDWSDHTNLPVDSETYARAPARGKSAGPTAAARTDYTPRILAAAGLLVLCATITWYSLRRRR